MKRETKNLIKQKSGRLAEAMLVSLEKDAFSGNVIDWHKAASAAQTIETLLRIAQQT